MNVHQKLANSQLLIKRQCKQIKYLIVILKNQKMHMMTMNKSTKILHKQKVSIKISLRKRIKKNNISSNQRILLILRQKKIKIFRIKTYPKIKKKIQTKNSIIRRCKKCNLLLSNRKKIFKLSVIKQKNTINNKMIIMRRILMSMDKTLRTMRIKNHLKNLKQVLI